MGTQKPKILIGAAIALATAATAFGISLTTNDKPKDTTPSVQTSQVQTHQTEVSYKGVETKNALELLKKSHKVATKTYAGLGELVTSIDGTAADSKHFWALYVNGQQSQVGADAYITKTTDKVTWKLEEIK